MAAVISDKGINSISSSIPGKWLLQREKLEAIASVLEGVNKQFNYREVVDEQLIDLQEYCFKAVFEMCERGEKDTVEQIQNVVKGLRNLSGNTIFFTFICNGKEAKSPDAIAIQLNLAHLLSDEAYKYALHQALKTGRSCTALEIIKDQGHSSPLQIDSKGRMPIHIAVKMNRADAIKHLLPIVGKAVMPIICLSYHSNKKNINLCPLSLAVLKGHIQCVDELIKAGVSLADVRIGDEKMTLFHLAIYMNQFKMLKHLLIKHFDSTRCLLNLPNSQGYTPVILAAKLGDIASIILLVNKGGDLHSCDLQGKTAVHHAVMRKDKAMLRVLAEYGADLGSMDINRLQPRQLITDDEAFDNFIVNLKNNKELLQLEYNGNFYLNPPENLVFKGGGPTGIAYLGPIKVLEKHGIFAHVKRIAGTSAGAITAALLAVGCNATEVEKLLKATPGTYFFDHHFTSKRMERFGKDNLSPKLLKEIYDTISACITNGSPIAALKAIGLKLVNSVWGCTGLCEGELFLEWIETKIARETQTSYCTFGELADFIAQDKTNPQGNPFKHLHVFATKIGQNPEIVRFSSEDSACKDLIISEAIRASMSIPFVFKPHVLVFKTRKENGADEFHTHHSTYKSNSYQSIKEALRVDENKTEPSYIDGGLIYNFPIDAFDKRQYIYNNCSEKDKNFPEFNHRTLGFSLHSPDDKTVFKEHSTETLGDIVKGIYYVFRHAETLLDKLEPYNSNRVIALNNQGIGLLEFGTNPMEGKGKKAIEEAEKQTEDFFKKQEEQASGFMSLSSVEALADPDLEEVAQREPEVSKNITKEFELTPINADWLWLRYGLVRTTVAEVIGICMLSYFYTGAKAIQECVDPISFERDANWHAFRVLKARNPSLQLFDHIENEKIEWVINQSFEKNKQFFTHPDFSPKVLPLLVFNDNAKQIQYLANKGIPVNVTCEDGIPLLHHIVPYDCLNAFEALVSAPDYKLDTVDKTGNTILHCLVHHNKIDAYDILVKHQKIETILNVRNDEKMSAILIAAQFKRMDLFNKLVALPNIDLTTTHPKSGKTILHYLVEADAEKEVAHLFNNTSKETLNQIINLEDQRKNSILFKTQNRNILKLLIENGMDLTKLLCKQRNCLSADKREINKTLLYILAKNDDVELVKLFCKKLKERHPGSFQQVLNQQVKSNQFNSSTQTWQLKTALIIAAQKNNYKVVKILIEAKADFRKKIDGLSPLAYAPSTLLRSESRNLLWQAWYGNVRRPLSSREKLNALYMCCSHGKFEAAQRLILKKIFPFGNRRDADGNGLLLIVMKSSSISKEQKRTLVALLLEKGDNINQADGTNGTTPLMLAANQNSAIMELLLKVPGINIDHQDKRKNTALHHASSGNHLKRVNILLTYHSNPNIQNEEGKSPLHLTKKIEIIEKLVMKGANPLLKDELGKTARDYAEFFQNSELTAFLKKCEEWFRKSNLI